MRPRPGNAVFPDMPEAEVFLRAIRRLDFRSDNDDPDLLRPPVDADVSGRSNSAGGPFSRAASSIPEPGSFQEYATIVRPGGALFAELDEIEEEARGRAAPSRMHGTSIDAPDDRLRQCSEPARGCPLDAEPTSLPVVRGLASLLFPGWGQSLNGQPRKAAAFRTVYLVTLALAATLAWREPMMESLSFFVIFDRGHFMRLLGTGLFAGACGWLLSAYDAIVVASSRR